MRPARLLFLAVSSLLLVAACKKPPKESESKSSTLETTSADSPTGPTVASKPIGPGEKPKPVPGPVDYSLGESGVAIRIPAGLVIVPSEIDGFFDIQKNDRRSSAIAQIMHTFPPKSAAEHAKDACQDKQSNVVTTAIAGGGFLTTCEGSSQAIKIAGMDIKTTKVRASFPIEEKNRDSSWGGWQCHYESDNAENIALTKKVCGSFHAVPVTHAVDPETKDLKPGARCFRDSNCGWVPGCSSMECKPQSGGSHEKVCRVDIEHGRLGQPCGATRSPHLLQHFPSSTAYVPESGKTVICDLDDGLFCDPSTWTCQPPAKLGGACGDKTACARDTVCKSGTCVAAAKPGESCADKRCVAGAKCDDKKICRAYPAAGSPCVFGKNECEYGCSDKKCNPKPAERQCSL